MRRRALSLSLLAAAMAALGGALHGWRTEAVLQRPLLPVNFDHHAHAAVKCASCHHNFFDDTGSTACFFCHKQQRALALGIEEDFHMFCRSCHEDLARRGFHSGPARRCGGCHDPAAGNAARERP